jgi:pyridoxal phosphate enzyme (YggS family)
MNAISENFAAVRNQIRQAEQSTGRKAESVKLIAVSKFHPETAVQEALDCGHRIFGENRVQEAAAKYILLRQTYPDLELHLIGPLQTNKAEDAVRLFDVIETLDRTNLAASIAKAMMKVGRTPRLYIEVNIGNELQKAGIAPEQLPAFLDICTKTYGLTISGLMCIPPHGIPPEPFFTAMKVLADQHHLPHLSMGMSADFESAIRHGATEVRVGTALFGERPPSAQA